MKILISYRGIPQSPGWATGDLLVTAFQDLGHEVYVYGYYYSEEISKWKHPLPNSILPSHIMDYEFDLHIYMEMNDPNPQYLELKHVKAKKRVAWIFDISYYEVNIMGLLHYMNFDYLFLANPNYAERIHDFMPVALLPYAFCPHKHLPNSFPEKKYRFAMVGSLWKERKEIASALRDSGIPVNIIQGKFREEYVKALAESHVIINHNVEQGRGLLVMRAFETLAAKSCLVHNDGDNIEFYLDTATECKVYKNTRHLIGICKELNDDISVADWIADFGHRRALKEHSYQHRAKEILEVLCLE